MAFVGLKGLTVLYSALLAGLKEKIGAEDLAKALIALTNNAGQVKVKYTGLRITGFTAHTSVLLSLRNSTAAVLDAPTTMWPSKATADGEDGYVPGFFVRGAEESADRIRENNVPGQAHRWRVAGRYTNKDIGTMGELRCYIINPDSGFRISDSRVVMSGITENDFVFEFSSVADNASLLAGRGYQMGFVSMFDDPGLTVTVNSIVRFSEATEIEVRA